MGERERISLYSYTAKQAIEEGVLLEINSEWSEEAGYRWPVRITQGVSALAAPTAQERHQGHTFPGHLGDILWLARSAISNVQAGERIAPFDITLGKRIIRLWACLDTSNGPAIHITTPQEY